MVAQIRTFLRNGAVSVNIALHEALLGVQHHLQRNSFQSSSNVCVGNWHILHFRLPIIIATAVVPSIVTRTLRSTLAG